MAQNKIKLLHGHEEDPPLTASILHTAGKSAGKCKSEKKARAKPLRRKESESKVSLRLSGFARAIDHQ
jgi:hypothetical protein